MSIKPPSLSLKTVDLNSSVNSFLSNSPTNKASPTGPDMHSRFLPDEHTPERFCACLDNWLPACIVGFIEMICAWVNSICGKTEAAEANPSSEPNSPKSPSPRSPVAQPSALAAAAPDVQPAQVNIIPCAGIRKIFNLDAFNWENTYARYREMDSSGTSKHCEKFESTTIIHAVVTYKDGSTLPQRMQQAFTPKNRGEYRAVLDKFRAQLETDKEITDYKIVILGHSRSGGLADMASIATYINSTARYGHPRFFAWTFNEYLQEVRTNAALPPDQQDKQIQLLSSVLKSQDFPLPY